MSVNATSASQGGNGKMVKIAAMLALFALLAFVISACGSDDNGSDTDDAADTTAADTGNGGEEANLAFFGFASANAYTQAAWQAAQQQAEEMGASIRFFDGEFDADVQYRQVQDAIASGQYNGFLIMPNDGAGLVPVVEQAIEDGIEVVALEFAIGPEPTTLEPQVDGITATVGYDIVSGATTVADLVIEQCEGKDPCQVALMYGDRSTLFDQIRDQTASEVLAGADNIEVVADVDAGFLRDDGATAARDILSANPNIDVIASPAGDQMILGAQLVVDEAGDEVALIGLGGAESAVAAVRAGDWVGTYIHLPATEGQVGAELIIQAINGEDVDPVYDLHGVAPVGPIATQEALESDPSWEPEWEG